MIWLAIAYLVPGAVLLWMYAPGSYRQLQREYGEVQPAKFVLTQIVVMLTWPMVFILGGKP